VDEISRSRALSVLLGVAACAILIASMRAAAELVVPFLLALFLSAIVTPLIDVFSKWGLPRWLAVASGTLIFIAVGLGGLALLAVTLNDFLLELPDIQQELASTRDEVLTWLDKQGFDLPQETTEEAGTLFDPKGGIDLLMGLLSGLRNIASNGLLILITVLFILLESVAYPAKLRAILGHESPSIHRAIQIVEDLRRYMLIKSWISLLTGLAAGLGLWLLGVRSPVLWGILAFLLNYIPNLGSLIAAIPPVVLAAIENGTVVAIAVVILYLAINFVVGYLIEPPAMGRGLGLSTLVVWLSLVFWGWVLGPVGMFLSVPLTMTFKIIFEGAGETRWLAILLGPAVPEPELEADARAVDVKAEAIADGGD